MKSGSRVTGVDDVVVFGSADGLERICRLIDEQRTGTTRLAAGLYWLAAGHTHEVDVHPESEEIYYVVQGRGQVRLDDEEYAVRAGQTVHIPAGVHHQTTNTGDEELVYFYVYAPPPAEPPRVTQPWAPVENAS